MSKKTQLISTDLLLASTIFIIIITVTTFSLWTNYSTRINNKIELTKMEIKSFHIADTLVKSPGIPEGWENLNNEDQIIIPGLAIKNKEISQEKVNKFGSLSEETIKTKLKIKNYNFYLSLETLNGLPIKTISSIPQNPKRIFSIKDYVLYNENGQKQDAIIKIEIWE